MEDRDGPDSKVAEGKPLRFTITRADSSDSPGAIRHCKVTKMLIAETGGVRC